MAGLIRKVSVEGMPDRYDRVERHDHLVCSKCGKLLDVTLSDLTEQIQKQIDIPILSYDLKLMYICEDCRKKYRRNKKGEEYGKASAVERPSTHRAG